MSSRTTGTEHRVQQRSRKWFELRRTVLLTASVFCEAVGLGKGKPYDFFLHLLSEDSHPKPDVQNHATQHGIAMEETLMEIYILLTGNKVRESGFWTPSKEDGLRYLIGASPDGIVYSDDKTIPLVGLVEFKAPVYKMYSGNKLIRGIPRHYMIQVQGQMAVCGAPWCDFLAACTKTREILFKRVFFHPVYWSNVSERLKLFCHTLQEARIRKEFGQEHLSFEGACKLKEILMQTDLIPGEDDILVTDQLERTQNGDYKGPSRVPLSFDVLLGSHCQLISSHGDSGDRVFKDCGERSENAAAVSDLLMTCF